MGDIAADLAAVKLLLIYLVRNSSIFACALILLYQDNVS